MVNVIRLLLARILPWVALAHAVLFAAFWLTNNLFYSSTNDYLADLLKSRMDYISLVLWITGLVGLFGAALLILARWWPEVAIGWLVVGTFAIVSLLYLALFYGSFSLLLREAPIQRDRLGHMLAYFRVIIDPFLFLGAAILAGVGLRGYLHLHPTASRLPLLSLALVALAGLWIVPLLLPPGSVYRGALPPKPKIIAHRGASMLAPENTLEAAQRAAQLGVYGLETDIHISQDGQPFLMHDDTLARTTNVAEVFPDRENDRAETFTLAEVRRLSAGKWFAEQDPFGTAAGSKASFAKQQVPTLAEELEIARSRSLVFIFDLKQPPDGHPDQRSYFDIVLREILRYGINGQIWYLVTPEELQVVNNIAPGVVPAAGIDYQHPPRPEALKVQGYQLVNSEYGLTLAQIHAYKQAGLWVNLYTVDEPWLYSRLWLLGVDSTTTNNSQTLQAMDHPILALPYASFLLLWGVIGVIGIAMTVLVAG